MSGIKKKFVNP